MRKRHGSATRRSARRAVPGIVSKGTEPSGFRLAVKLRHDTRVSIRGACAEYTLNEVRAAGNFFGVDGTRPAVGRLLTADDDRAGGPQVAVPGG